MRKRLNLLTPSDRDVWRVVLLVYPTKGMQFNTKQEEKTNVCTELHETLSE